MGSSSGLITIVVMTLFILNKMSRLCLNAILEMDLTADDVKVVFSFNHGG